MTDRITVVEFKVRNNRLMVRAFEDVALSKVEYGHGGYLKLLEFTKCPESTMLPWAATDPEDWPTDVPHFVASLDVDVVPVPALYEVVGVQRRGGGRAPATWSMRLDPIETIDGVLDRIWLC